MILKPDCSHFPGDRPCRFHKELGIKCDACPHYAPVRETILVIKFDALGDVLRTTALLPSLRKRYPAARIAWLTKGSARDLFDNNPYVDEVLACEDPATLAQLQARTFDLVIHPDASPASAAYASLARANAKRGFALDATGRVEPLNPEAREWFEMGAFDDLKKANTKTYQQVIHEIAGVPWERSEIVIRLTEAERARARAFATERRLERFDFIVGLNTGAGGRWTYKKWTIPGYEALVRALQDRYNCGILLYGGPEERERNATLAAASPNVIDTGTDNALRDFFGRVDLSDVFVTGDTMALHAATALGKRVVCLFGPTSAHEIEDYDRITKIQPRLDCLVCYKMDCDFVPNCMASISSDTVLEAIAAHVAQGALGEPRRPRVPAIRVD
jgi:heptosyltransferase-2